MNHTSYKHAWYCCALFTLCWFMTAMYLPILPILKYALTTNDFFIKIAISGFFVAFCFGQILWGPIADNHKKNNIISLTLGLSLIGTFLCVISTHIELFILGRLLQGFGIGAIPAITRSMINDIYEHTEVLKLMVYLTSIIAVATSIAPLLGAFFLEHAGWRSIFAFQFIFCLILLIISRLSFQKSFNLHPPKIKQSILSGYHQAIRNHTVLFHMTTYALIIGSIVAFYSCSPFLFIKTFNMSPENYGTLLLCASLFYIFAVTVVRLLINQLTPEQMLLTGICFSFLGGIVLFVLTLFGIFTLWSIIIPLLIYTFGAAFIPPITSTEAMQALPQLSGTVSSLLGAALALSSGILSYILVNLPVTHFLLFVLFFISIPVVVLIYYCFLFSTSSNST